tara:strand:- start:1407 stop:1646 length:240 start_codon:yes stop_codon:yes gene_type:complete
MPLYTLRDNSDGEVFEVSLSIAELDELLESNKHLEQLIVKPPVIGDPIRLGIRKPDSGFRDVLKEVKKKHPLGGGVNTF